jgi:hypothetical protein
MNPINPKNSPRRLKIKVNRRTAPMNIRNAPPIINPALTTNPQFDITISGI